MSYYMGDFYGGNNRRGTIRGDPGFFSFLGGVAKSALGFIPGVGPTLSKIVSSVGARQAPVGAITKAIQETPCAHSCGSSRGDRGWGRSGPPSQTSRRWRTWAPEAERLQSSCAASRDTANTRLRQTRDEDNPSGPPEEESSLRGLPQEEGEALKQCPSCGAQAFDPDLEYCEECGWEPEEEEEDGEE